MFCMKCGAKNEAGHKFCLDCGAPLINKEETARNEQPPQIPARPVEGPRVNAPAAAGAVPPAARKKRGLLSGIIAAAVIILVGVAALILLKPMIMGGSAHSGALAISIRENKYATPDDAIKQFVSSIAKNDFSGALKACAVNEQAQNYDAVALYARMHMISPSSPLPKEYAFYQNMNVAYFLNTLSWQTRCLTYSFSDSAAVQDVLTGKTHAFQDPEAEAAQYVKDVDPAIIKNLAVVRIDLPKPELFNSEDNMRNYRNNAATAGADEATERVVLYQLNGQFYLGGFTLYNYNNNWKICSLSAAVGGIAAYGTAQKISESDYTALIS